MSRQTRRYEYDFRGNLAFPALASNVGTPFDSKITKTSGSPTISGVNGGGLRMALTSDVEVQNLCLYMGDVLPFNIGDIISMWAIVRTVASLAAAESIAFGLASARNDTITSISDCALFVLSGSNAVTIRTTDGTTTKNAIATPWTLGTNWSRFQIDFASRNTTVEPPSLSLGRTSNIEFYGANSNGSLRRGASGTRFDMTQYTSGLQLFAQFQKTSNAAADTFDILEMGVEVDMPKYT